MTPDIFLKKKIKHRAMKTHIQKLYKVYKVAKWKEMKWDRGSKIVISRGIRLIFFTLFNHIFLLPMSNFWCSGPVRKCLENGKNRKEKLNGCWWLYRKFSDSGELFCSWRFFNIFCFKMSSIKFSFRISNWFFPTFWAWSQKLDAKSKKWVPKQKKRH